MLGNCFSKFDNGTICFVKQVGGGFDANGNPIEAATEDSQPYPCHITVNSDSKKGKNRDGRFQVCNYEIYMNKLPIEAEMVKLTQDGKDLGEFEIQAVVPSRLLNRVKILV